MCSTEVIDVGDEVTMRYARHQPENAAYDAIRKLAESQNRVEEDRASYEAA